MSGRWRTAQATLCGRARPGGERSDKLELMHTWGTCRSRGTIQGQSGPASASHFDIRAAPPLCQAASHSTQAQRCRIITVRSSGVSSSWLAVGAMRARGTRGLGPICQLGCSTSAAESAAVPLTAKRSERRRAHSSRGQVALAGGPLVSITAKLFKNYFKVLWCGVAPADPVNTASK